jgi:hypothetical protein
VTVVEYMLHSTENLLVFVQYPKAANHINICENGILLYVSYSYKYESFRNNIYVTSNFISSFLVSSFVWTDCSSFGSQASKECYTATENQ